MLKNAIAYILRKRNRTCIVFIILTLVLSFLYSCLNISKSTSNLEKNLYKISNTSLSITKNNGDTFETNQFKELDNIKEIKEIITMYDGLARTTNIKVVDGTQLIERDDLSDEFKNMLSVEATNNSEKDNLFSSGIFTIIKGRHIKNNDTAVYQDATFFVKGDKNLDKVIKNIEKLDIDWQQYNLIKSSNNYPALQQSISGIYKIANKLFAGSLLFAGVTVSLLLFLWMNARKKEIAILLSLGISKAKIFGQFVIELVFVSIPAFIGSYFLAVYTASMIGNNILSKVTGTIAKQIAKQGESSQLGGGAEVDGFNKTLTSLEINISPKLMIYVILFMSIVLMISLLISSSRNLRKSPKELLIDTK